MTWLPHSLSWRNHGLWGLFGKKPASQYGGCNHYGHGGSFYPWPYHCGKPLAYPRPQIYVPSAALYYHYPVTLRPTIAKPTISDPAIAYYPHQQQPPVVWRDHRLVTSSVLLRNPLKRHKSIIHSDLSQPQQHQQPVVVAPNGIFILNSAGSSDPNHVTGGKELGSSTESRQQLKAESTALLTG